MAPISAKIWENSFQTIPDVSFVDAGNKKKNDFPKLQTAIYPSNMAPIGAKLWENAFQTIPDVSFFDA